MFNIILIYKKSIDVDSWEGFVTVGSGGIWETSVCSAQFCCEFITVLKSQVL